MPGRVLLPLFFFNDTATTEIYTLSLHDALPIFPRPERCHDRVESRRHCLDRLHGCRAGGGLSARRRARRLAHSRGRCGAVSAGRTEERSEEHTSELQSHLNLVCRLLLEKKKCGVGSVKECSSTGPGGEAPRAGASSCGCSPRRWMQTIRRRADNSRRECCARRTLPAPRAE